MTDPLERFSPPTRGWFRETFEAPTPSQAEAWREITSGQHTLVIAPTGSGKTLAAFLTALDRLTHTAVPEDPKRRCRVLYVSPMKALVADVRRNLRTPLAGIEREAHRLGEEITEVGVATRTGDTPTDERRAFGRRPSDILVTTPESLFLLLTSTAREALRGVETVIVDEVHAMAGDKRGAHLAVSLDRLDELSPGPAQRIGLSATVRPVDEVSEFLAGGRPVRVVRPPDPKQVDVSVRAPVEDMARPESGTAEGDGTGGRAASVWPALRERILELVRRHRSTIVFTNSRRLAERLTSGLNELAAERGPDGADGADGASTTPRDGPWSFPAEAVGASGVTSGVAAVVARAHHGSMSKQQRASVEEELKSGELPCVVATSSLELGIDMGTVDLVVQLETPPSVASGTQRIGRGGHRVGEPSRGVVFPKFRGDLVGCAVVAERMRSGAIEALSIPRNPLDVLAQQIVAAVAVDVRGVEELATLLRRSAPFAALPESAFRSVLDMLAGRYPSEEFGELRARIVWDRTTDELRPRPGTRRLAVTSGGTIPDRGLFTVVTRVSDAARGSGRKRVGELDEEMVHESRVGDTFLLGTSSWRISEITHDQVIVTPAPGTPARMPFWKGDSTGRPLELGRAVGGFLREISSATSDGARERTHEAGLDRPARENLLAYLAEQRAATGHVPDDHTIVVERFRDELGDWRIVVHSPFGERVNAPWALALGTRLRERGGADVRPVSADEGIVLRVSDALDDSGAEVVPNAEDVVLAPEEVEQLVTDSIAGSALFASRFRECAGRALLLPRRDPGRRAPLWQQRQRATRLLEVAARYERFPIVLEAMRECLRDAYDVAGLRELMSEIARHRIRVVEVSTTGPSPFARSLLFGYAGMFLYESDAPLAERRSAALSLDTALLAELLGSEEMRQLLDTEVVVEVENGLQRLERRRHARGPEDTADMLRVLGDLTEDEAAARGIRREWLAELARQQRALLVHVAGEARWIAVEDAGRVRDGLGVALPERVPEVFTERVEDPLGELVSRFARCRGPFRADALAERFGLGAAVVTEVLERLRGSGRLVRGELRPAGAGGDVGAEYCDAEVLRRLRRASLAKLRSEIEPAEPAALGRFLPVWQGVVSNGVGSQRDGSAADVLAVVEQLAGVPLTAGSLESLVLPARVPGYQPAMLDELTTGGEVVWVGAGALAHDDGWVALAPSDIAELVLPDRVSGHENSDTHDAVRESLEDGALFFRQLADRATELLDRRGGTGTSEATLVSALWDLVWSGEVTNDTLAPLRALLSGRRANRRPRRVPRGRYARPTSVRAVSTAGSGPPGVTGRWSLAPTPSEETTSRASARTETFLQRHGVLTRGSLEIERVTGGFAAVYRVLRIMEEAGGCGRGYVVAGLGPAQFAAPGAIDRLRDFDGSTRQQDPDRAVLLAATDPAQPYGAALPWPEVAGNTRHRPGRKAGALVVLVDGEPVFYIERGGKSLLSFTERERPLRAAAGRLAEAVTEGELEQLVFRRADGESAIGGELAGILVAAGFRPTPQGLRLRN
ncbi:ATP-dependent helicase Lhr and Lhr-like helicase [Actinopolyspora lacussalsi subsp. righensis]|uniref:ATP-dependent helicase Lhr and Lhr-like helicase n=1 Tax=Actinopolyspora righensis TaxID=995060 RepID=A0A1I7AVQ3_9ACTN|nr:ATP-dependent helicase [Actinopolyspora righensis]SFT79013.1 ATP-dependent helicase Lhr and Lhr-like helicase [Actinopolyspora righensis]